MLVLTRKQGESIHIGNNIYIKVVKTASGSVKIGIEAPTEVRVTRGELLALPQTAPAKDPAATSPQPDLANLTRTVSISAAV